MIWPVHPKAKPLIAEFVTEKDAKDHLNRRQEYIKQRREGDTSEKNNKDGVESSEEEGKNESLASTKLAYINM